MENERRKHFEPPHERRDVKPCLENQHQFAGIIENTLSQQGDPEILRGMRDKDPNLYKYISEVGSLRLSIQKELNSRPKNLDRYNAGAVMMYEMIKGNYRLKNEKTPKINERITQTAFTDLMGGEDTQHEASILSDLNRKSTKKPLTPQDVLERPISDQQIEATKTIWKNIIERSRRSAYDLELRESAFFGELVQQATSVESLLERADNEEKFEEYKYGALDVFMNYNIYEETKNLRDMNKTPIKNDINLV